MVQLPSMQRLVYGSFNGIICGLAGVTVDSAATSGAADYTTNGAVSHNALVSMGGVLFYTSDVVLGSAPSIADALPGCTTVCFALWNYVILDCAAT